MIYICIISCCNIKTPIAKNQRKSLKLEFIDRNARLKIITVKENSLFNQIVPSKKIKPAYFFSSKWLTRNRNVWHVLGSPLAPQSGVPLFRQLDTMTKKNSILRCNITFLLPVNQKSNQRSH